MKLEDLGKLNNLTSVEMLIIIEFKEAIKNKKVVLIDDVSTTGSTLRECAKTLQKAGAKEVCVLVYYILLERRGSRNYLERRARLIGILHRLITPHL